LPGNLEWKGRRRINLKEVDGLGLSQTGDFAENKRRQSLIISLTTPAGTTPMLRKIQRVTTIKKALGSCALVVIFKVKLLSLGSNLKVAASIRQQCYRPKEHAAPGARCPAQLGPKGTLPSTAEFTVRLTAGAIR
jgi:hypothetical protein